ncbi:MAG TPA: hypothetical protein DCR14_06395 [Acidimicrobiaceae bacterium]|nr:hypothetical protein [Acidimicrobiaceae bacterium]
MKATFSTRPTGRRGVIAGLAMALMVTGFAAVPVVAQAEARPTRIPECPPGYEAELDAATGMWICVPVAPPPPPPSPRYDGPTYTDARLKVVTLGDSYSSGTGIWREDSSYDEQFGGYQSSGLYLTGRSDQECWREWHDTPGPRYAAANNRRSIFLACKGAEASHVGNQVTVMQGQWPTDAAAKWSGAVVLLTAGGNDLRTGRGEDWPSLLERCIIEINPFGGCHDNSNNHINNWSTVQTRLQNLYTSLAQKATNAKIRIMGYPRIMTPTKNWLGIWQCPDVTGVTGNEARWIDQQVDALNSRIATAVNNVKAQFPAVDIKYVPVTSYLTVGACFGQQPFAHVNDRVTAWSGSGILLTSDASFHPTLLGYRRYYDALVANL